MLLFFDAGAHVTSQEKRWESVGDNGIRKSRAFCSTCSSPAYMKLPPNPNRLAATARSLDDPARYGPQFVTWAAGEFDWDHVEPSLPCFEKRRRNSATSAVGSPAWLSGTQPHK
jgi:hypothetical protein